MPEVTFRNLANLERSGSTARVLNLLKVARRHACDPEYAAKPLFRNSVLNRSIILKHRLRRDELDLFGDDRRTATKVIFPIDSSDLRLGGRYTFVGQRGFEASLASLFGEQWHSEFGDQETLQILDSLPSLDPFLLREHLRRHNRHPARIYFDVSDSDLQRMIHFVQSDIRLLIDLCYADGDSEKVKSGGARLVDKILSMTVDADTEPLRLTMKLGKQEYAEGVFCWKGFLYYKWVLNECVPDLNRVISALKSARPRGHVGAERKTQLARTLRALQLGVLTVCRDARRTLKIYDAAFGKLVDGQPYAFRDFLLTAPSLFTELGEQLGAVNHIISFWNFRFPRGLGANLTADELIDLLREFEASLMVGEPGSAPAAKPDREVHVTF